MRTLNQTTATQSIQADDGPFIRLHGVSKIYAMGTTSVKALDGVDLEIAAHRFTAVVGRSGSGKSTLLHLLAAMDRPTHGEVVVGSWRLSALTRREQARYRREMVGMVFQQFNLIPSMTALQNVELPLLLAGVAPNERRARALRCLDLVDLSHRTTHRPTELSGGEQQRVAIARALVHNPPLLLADEPTGNIDSVTGARIVALLARLHREQGKNVIVVTHHLDEVASVADHIFALHDGRLMDPERIPD